MEKVTRLRAVVFDFDGTLARPTLDFALMKRRIGELGAGYPCGRAEPGPLPALEWIERLAGRMAIQTAFSACAAAHRPMATLRSFAFGAFQTRTADRVVAENTAGRIRLNDPRGRAVSGASSSVR